MALQELKIPRRAYELPLLKSLIELGGSTVPDDNLYRLVAEKLRLPENEMEYDAVHAHPKWVYELQWVRYTLVKSGEMDGSQRGVWKVTEKGRERVRSEWDAFQVDDYISDRTAPSTNEGESTPESDTVEETTDTFATKFVPESLDAIKGPILIEDTPVNQIITILNANRHLIMTGPPGTGKTTISTNLAMQAVKTNFISGYLLTTATTDWTTFDTIGGYMPQSDRELTFTPGIVLRAIRENKWLIIDEINRADMDKAFGPLLTILSGQDVELPFTDKQGNPIRICHAQGLKSYYHEESARYLVGDNWRIIGTMNTLDKNSLFALSYALMRRFGFVHINNPSAARLHSIINGRVQDGHLTNIDAGKIERLLALAPRELGPAILIDMLNYMKERKGPDAFFESVVAYVLPQFEGLSVEAITKFFKEVAGDLGGKENESQMKRYLSVMFEIEAGAWDSA